MLHEAMAGVAGGVVAEGLLYGVDSYKVIMQAGAAGHARSGKARPSITLSSLFRGMGPMLLTGAGPTFGIFFGLYEPLKRWGVTAVPEGYGVAACTAASVVAGAVSSVCSVPSDVVKKQLFLGGGSGGGGVGINVGASGAGSGSTPTSHTSRTVVGVVRDIMKRHGPRGFFLGTSANLVKDLPFAALKMTLYETATSMYLRMQGEVEARQLTPPEAALVGFASGSATGIITCPLDVVNIRIKSGELREFTLLRAHNEVVRRDGATALFRGVAPRTFILGVGSTIFWAVYNKTRTSLDAYTHRTPD